MQKIITRVSILYNSKNTLKKGKNKNKKLTKTIHNKLRHLIERAKSYFLSSPLFISQTFTKHYCYYTKIKIQKSKLFFHIM